MERPRGKDYLGRALEKVKALRISFLLRSVYDVLPSSLNLLKWAFLKRQTGNYVVQGTQ